MVNYNLQQAPQSAMQTITPVTRFESADNLKELGNLISGLETSAIQGYTKGLTDAAKEKEREDLNAFQKEVSAFMQESQRIQMPHSQMRVGLQEIQDRHPLTKPAERTAILKAEGFENIKPAMSRVAETDEAAEAERLAEENKKLRQIGTEMVGAFNATNMSGEELEDIGRKAIASQQIVDFAASVDNDSSASNGAKQGALSMAANEIAKGVNIDAVNTLQNGGRIDKVWYNTQLEGIYSRLVTEKEMLPNSAKYIAEKSLEIWKPFVEQSDISLEDQKKYAGQVLSTTKDILNTALMRGTGISPEYIPLFTTPGLLKDEDRLAIIKAVNETVTNRGALKDLVGSLAGGRVNEDGTVNLPALGEGVSAAIEGMPLTDNQFSLIMMGTVDANNGNLAASLRNPSRNKTADAMYNFEWINEKLNTNPQALINTARKSPANANAIKNNYTNGVIGLLANDMIEAAVDTKGALSYSNGYIKSTEPFKDEESINKLNRVLINARTANRNIGGVLLDEDKLSEMIEAGINSFKLNLPNVEPQRTTTKTPENMTEAITSGTFLDKNATRISPVMAAGKAGDTERQAALLERSEDPEVFLHTIDGMLKGGATGAAVGGAIGSSAGGVGAGPVAFFGGVFGAASGGIRGFAEAKGTTPGEALLTGINAAEEGIQKRLPESLTMPRAAMRRAVEGFYQGITAPSEKETENIKSTGMQEELQSFRKNQETLDNIERAAYNAADFGEETMQKITPTLNRAGEALGELNEAALSAGETVLNSSRDDLINATIRDLEALENEFSQSAGDVGEAISNFAQKTTDTAREILRLAKEGVIELPEETEERLSNDIKNVEWKWYKEKEARELYKRTMTGSKATEEQKLVATQEVVNYLNSFKDYRDLPDGTTKAVPGDTINNLKEEEGFFKKVEKDSLGYPTIGYGFKLDTLENMWKAKDKYGDALRNVIPDFEKFKNGTLKKNGTVANSILNILYASAKERAINFIGKDNFDKLSHSQKEAVVDIFYNQKNANKYTGMRDAIIRGDFERAAYEIVNSKAAREQITGRATRNAWKMLH